MTLIYLPPLIMDSHPLTQILLSIKIHQTILPPMQWGTLYQQAVPDILVRTAKPIMAQALLQEQTDMSQSFIPYHVMDYIT